MNRDEERSLLERCQAGEGEAYEPIVRALEGRLFRYFYGLPRDTDEARDLTQDTFIRAYYRLHLYCTDRPLVPWLFMIARNLHVDRLRSRNGRDRESTRTSQLLPMLPDPGPAPDRAAGDTCCTMKKLPLSSGPGTSENWRRKHGIWKHPGLEHPR